MGPPLVAGTTAGPPVDSTTQLSELVRRVAACEDPLPVLDADGRVVGSIDRGRVLMAMAGDELDASGDRGAAANEPVLSAAELVELAELESVEAVDDSEHAT
jgi:hypothetical protein